MDEIVSKRQYNSKTFQTGAREFVYDAHVGHIFYKENGIFTPVDYTLVDGGTYWEIVKASYHIYIYKDFSANQLIRFENHYEGNNHTITYDPKVLAWVNATDFSDYQIFRSAQQVTGIINNNVIRYANAFGNGIHFEITIKRSGFTKEIVIDAKNKLENPPTSNHKLVALFKYTGDGIDIKNSQGISWNQNDYFEGDNFTLNRSATEYSIVKPAQIGDANGNRQSIKVFWKKHNNFLWQAKILPTSFLQNAVYPVRADTTTSYYVGTSDGTCSYDHSDWATCRGAGTGYGATTTASYDHIIKCGKISDGKYRIQRGYIPIDTSGLDDGVTITGATLKMDIYEFNYPDNDGYDFVTVVQSSQASPTALEVADYGRVGSTEGLDSGDRIDMSGATGGYQEFVLNATGIGWISKTGYSQFCLREGHDFSNHAYVGSNNTLNQGAAYFSEATPDTSHDPYISVTYSAGGATTVIKDFISLGFIPIPR